MFLGGTAFRGHAAKALFVGFFAFALGSAVEAAPRDGRVVKGSGRIESTGTHTDIHQHSDFLATQWRSFNIGANESVQAHQPSSSSRLLIRIDGGGATNIAGTFTANGITILENQNGVQFSRGAIVNVGGLLATSSRISGADSAHWQLSGTGGAVINHGQITAGAGGAILAAVKVQNTGDITAKGGDVALGAGSSFTVDFAGSMVGFEVTQAASGASITTSGKIEAQGGVVALSAQEAQAVRANVVSVGGVVKATKIERRGGVVYLSGGDEGIAEVSGKVQASDKVQATGKYVAVKDGAKVKAPEILVGGDYQGKGAVPTARRTLVERGALLDAGANGRVIVWSDETTWFDGRITAPGGFAEVSGKETLASVNLAGIDVAELLLDPATIAIRGEGATFDLFTGSLAADDLSGQNIVLSATEIGAFSGNLSLAASGSIVVEAAINKPTGNLTLIAGGRLTVNANINNDTNHLTLIAGFDERLTDRDLRGSGSITAGTLTLQQAPEFGTDAPYSLTVNALNLTTEAPQTVRDWMAGQGSNPNRSLNLTSGGAIRVTGPINVGTGNLTLTGSSIINDGTPWTLTGRSVSLTQDGVFDTTAPLAFANTVTALNLTTTTDETQQVHGWMTSGNRSLSVTAGTVAVIADVSTGTGDLTFDSSSQVVAAGTPTLTGGTVNLVQTNPFTGTTTPFTFNTDTLNLTTNAAQEVLDWMTSGDRALNLTSDGVITVAGMVSTGMGNLTLTGTSIELGGNTTLMGAAVSLFGPTSGAGNPDLTITAENGDIVIAGNVNIGTGTLMLNAGSPEVGATCQTSADPCVVRNGGSAHDVTAGAVIVIQDDIFSRTPLFSYQPGIQSFSYTSRQTAAQVFIPAWMATDATITGLTSFSLTTAATLNIGGDDGGGHRQRTLDARNANLTLTANNIVLSGISDDDTENDAITLAGNNVTLITTGDLELTEVDTRGAVQLTITAAATLTLDTDITIRDFNLGSSGEIDGSLTITANEIVVTPEDGITVDVFGGATDTIITFTDPAIQRSPPAEVRDSITFQDGTPEDGTPPDPAPTYIPTYIYVPFDCPSTGDCTDATTLANPDLVAVPDLDSDTLINLDLGDGTLSFSGNGPITIDAPLIIITAGNIDIGTRALTITASGNALTLNTDITGTGTAAVGLFATSGALTLREGSVLSLAGRPLTLNAGNSFSFPDANPTEASSITAASITLSGNLPQTMPPATAITFSTLPIAGGTGPFPAWFANGVRPATATNCVFQLTDCSLTRSNANLIIDDATLTASDSITIDIGTGRLTFGGMGPISITSDTVSITAGNIDIGTRALTITAEGGALTLNAGITGTAATSDVMLAATDGALTLGGNINAATGDITLSSTGSGAAIALGGNVELTGAAVQLTGAIDDAEGDNLTITARGNITLNSDVDLGSGELTLDAGTSGTGAIATTESSVTAAIADLTQPGAFVGTPPLTLTSVGTLNLTIDGSQTLHGWMILNDRNLVLTSTGSNIDITIPIDITTGNLAFNASRTVDVLSNITTGGNLTLTGGTGGIELGGASTTSISLAGAAVSLTGAIDESSSNNDNFTVTASGALTLNSNINLGRGELTLIAGMDGDGSLGNGGGTRTLTAATVNLTSDGALSGSLFALGSSVGDLNITLTGIAAGGATQNIHNWMINSGTNLSVRVTDRGNLGVPSDIVNTGSGNRNIGDGDLTLMTEGTIFILGNITTGGNLTLNARTDIGGLTAAARTLTANNITITGATDKSDRNNNLTISASGDITLNSNIDLGTGTLTLIAGTDGTGDIADGTGTPVLTAATVSFMQNSEFGGTSLFTFSSDALNLTTDARQELAGWMFSSGRNLSVTSGNAISFPDDVNIVNGGGGASDFDIGTGDLTLDASTNIVVSGNITTGGNLTLTGRSARAINIGGNRTSDVVFSGVDVMLTGEINETTSNHDNLTVTASGNLTINDNINLGSGALTLTAGTGSIVATSTPTLTADTVSLTQDNTFGSTAPFTFTSVNALNLTTDATQVIHDWMISSGRDLTLTTNGTANITVASAIAPDATNRNIGDGNITLMAGGEINLSANITTGGNLTLTGESGIALGGSSTVTISLAGANIQLTGAIDESADNDNLNVTASGDITINSDIDLGTGNLTLTAGTIADGMDTPVLTAATVSFTQDSAFGPTSLFTFTSVNQLNLMTGAAQIVHGWMTETNRGLSLTSSDVITIAGNVATGTRDLVLDGASIILDAPAPSTSPIMLSGADITLTGEIDESGAEDSGTGKGGSDGFSVMATGALTLNDNINVGSGALTLAGGSIVLGGNLMLQGGGVSLTGAIDETANNRNLTIRAAGIFGIGSAIDLGAGELEIFAGMIQPPTTTVAVTASAITIEFTDPAVTTINGGFVGGVMARDRLMFAPNPDFSLLPGSCSTAVCIIGDGSQALVLSQMLSATTSITIDAGNFGITFDGTGFLGVDISAPIVTITASSIDFTTGNVMIRATGGVLTLNTSISGTSTASVNLSATDNLVLGGNINLGDGSAILTAGMGVGTGDIMNGSTARKIAANSLTITQDSAFGPTSLFMPLADVNSLTVITDEDQMIHDWMLSNTTDLTVTANGTADVIVAAAINNATNLILNAGGAVDIRANITTSGNLTLRGGDTDNGIVLDGDITLMGADVSLTGVIDETGDEDTATGIGGSDALTVMASGTLTLNSNINTGTGDITLTADVGVVISSDITTGGDIELTGGTAPAPIMFTTRAVTLTAANIALNSNVQSAMGLTLIANEGFDQDIITDPDLNLGDDADFGFVGGGVMRINGSVTLGGDVTVAAGDLTITADHDLTLEGGTTLTAANVVLTAGASADDIRIAENVEGDEDMGLALPSFTDRTRTRTGNIIFSGTGAPILAAGGVSLTQDAAFASTAPFTFTSVNQLNLTTGAAQMVHNSWMVAANRGLSLTSGGALTIPADISTGNRDLALSGTSIVLGSDVMLTGAAVSLTGAIDESATGATGDDGLTITASGALTLNSNINTGTGSLALTGATIVLGGDLTLQGGAIALTGTIDESATGAGGNDSLTLTAGALTIGGDINVGTGELTLSGVDVLAGDGSLMTAGISLSGDTTLSGMAVTLTGTISEVAASDDNLTITATGGAITLNNNISLGMGNLTLSSTGVGAGIVLGGNPTLQGGDITLTGAIDISGAKGANSAVASASPNARGQDGRSITIDAGGNVTLNGGITANGGEGGNAVGNFRNIPGSGGNGGRITIMADGTVQINGDLSAARGEIGETFNPGDDPGGLVSVGAGGTITIIAGMGGNGNITFTNTPALTAATVSLTQNGRFAPTPGFTLSSVENLNLTVSANQIIHDWMINSGVNLSVSTLGGSSAITISAAIVSTGGGARDIGDGNLTFTSSDFNIIISGNITTRGALILDPASGIVIAANNLTLTAARLTLDGRISVNKDDQTLNLNATDGSNFAITDDIELLGENTRLNITSSGTAVGVGMPTLEADTVSLSQDVVFAPDQMFTFTNVGHLILTSGDTDNSQQIHPWMIVDDRSLSVTNAVGGINAPNSINLGAGNLTLNGGDFASSITFAASGEIIAGDVDFAGPAATQGGNNLTITASGAITFGGNVDLGAGDLTLTGATIVLSGDTTTFTANDITITGAIDITGDNGGDLGPTTLSSSGTGGDNGRTIIIDAGGNVVLNSAITANGGNGGGASNLSATTGNGGDGGTITIMADGTVQIDGALTAVGGARGVDIIPDDGTSPQFGTAGADGTITIMAGTGNILNGIADGDTTTPLPVFTAATVSLAQVGEFGATALFTFMTGTLALETDAAQTVENSWMVENNRGLSVTSQGVLTVPASISLGTGDLTLSGATIVLGGDITLTANAIDLTGAISDTTNDRVLTLTSSGAAGVIIRSNIALTGTGTQIIINAQGAGNATNGGATTDPDLNARTVEIEQAGVFESDPEFTFTNVGLLDLTNRDSNIDQQLQSWMIEADRSLTLTTTTVGIVIAGNVALGTGTLTLNAGTDGALGGVVRFNGADITAANVAFLSSSERQGGGLTVTTTGTIRFDGNVNGAAGDITLNAAGGIVLGGDVEISGVAVSLTGAIDESAATADTTTLIGGNDDLTITTTGQLTLNSDINLGTGMLTINAGEQIAIPSPITLTAADPITIRFTRLSIQNNDEGFVGGQAAVDRIDHGALMLAITFPTADCAGQPTDCTIGDGSEELRGVDPDLSPSISLVLNAGSNPIGFGGTGPIMLTSDAITIIASVLNIGARALTITSEGGTITLNTNITGTGNITLDSDTGIVLGRDVTLTGAAIALTGAIDESAATADTMTLIGGNDALTITATGSVTINSNINTGTGTLTLSGATIVLGGATTLQGGAVALTGAIDDDEDDDLTITASGNITINDDIDLGTGALTLTATTGSILNGIADGDTTTTRPLLTALTVSLTAGGVFADNLFTLGSSVGSLIIETSASQIVRSWMINSNTNLTVRATDSTSSVTLLSEITNAAIGTGNITFDAGGTVFVRADITTGGNITLTGADSTNGIVLSSAAAGGLITMSGAAVSLTGVIDESAPFSSTDDIGGGESFTITATGNITINDDINLGTGTLTLTAGTSDSGNIGVGGAIPTLTATMVNLTQIGGFVSGLFALASSVENLAITTTANQTIHDWMINSGTNLSVTANTDSANVIVGDAIAATSDPSGDRDIGAGNITLTAGGSVVISNNITTDGNITLMGSASTAPIMFTANEEVTLTAANITFNSDVQSDSSVRTLTLIANEGFDGTSRVNGDVMLAGNVRMLFGSGALSITADHDITLAARALTALFTTLIAGNSENDIEMGGATLTRTGNIMFSGSGRPTLPGFATSLTLTQDSAFGDTEPLTINTLSRLNITVGENQTIHDWMINPDTDLTLTTTGTANVTVATAIVSTADNSGGARDIGAGALTLDAGGSVIISASIASSGDLSLTGGAATAPIMFTENAVTLDIVGSITLKSPATSAMSLTLMAADTLTLMGNVTTASGNLTIDSGRIFATVASGITLSSAGDFTFTSGNITATDVDLTLRAGGAVTLGGNISLGTGNFQLTARAPQSATSTPLEVPSAITIVAATVRMSFTDESLRDGTPASVPALAQITFEDNGGGTVVPFYSFGLLSCEGRGAACVITETGDTTVAADLAATTSITITLTGGATLTFSGAGAITITSPLVVIDVDTIDLEGRTLTVTNGSGANLTLNANITNAAAINVPNAGMISFVGPHSIMGGAISLMAALIQTVDRTGTTNTAAPHDLTITATEGLTINTNINVGTATLALTAGMGATAGNIVDGATDGSLTLTADTLSLTQDGAFGDTAPFTFPSATQLTLMTDAAQTIENWMTSGNRGLSLTSGGVLTIGADVSTGTGNLTLGGMTIVLGGPVTLTGGDIALTGAIDESADGDSLTITASGILTLNDNINTGAGNLTLEGMSILLGGSGGTRTLAGGAVSLTGNLDSRVSDDGASANNITITAGSGDITITGDIIATGSARMTSGASNPGGNGGGVNLSATGGNIMITGNITTTGGIGGFNNITGISGTGGTGGAVTLMGGDITITGNINTDGGGAAVEPIQDAVTGGTGGTGGAVTITGSLMVQISQISANGGNGQPIAGNNASGAGGDGGVITVSGASVMVGLINASGGNPGSFDSSEGGRFGSDGAGGSVIITATGGNIASTGTPTLTAATVSLTQVGAFGATPLFTFMTDALTLQTGAAQTVHNSWMVAANRGLSLTAGGAITIGADISIFAADLTLIGATIVLGGDITLNADNVDLTGAINDNTTSRIFTINIRSDGTATIRSDIELTGSGSRIRIEAAGGGPIGNGGGTDPVLEARTVELIQGSQTVFVSDSVFTFQNVGLLSLDNRHTGRGQAIHEWMIEPGRSLSVTSRDGGITIDLASIDLGAGDLTLSALFGGVSSQRTIGIVAGNVTFSGELRQTGGALTVTASGTIGLDADINAAGLNVTLSAPDGIVVDLGLVAADSEGNFVVELTGNNIDLTGDISTVNASGTDRRFTITATTKLTLNGDIQTGTDDLRLNLGSAAADFTGARQLGGDVIMIAGAMGIVGTGDLTISALGDLEVNLDADARINVGANALTLEAGGTEGNGDGQTGVISFDDPAIILQAMFFLLIQDGAVFPATRPAVFQNAAGMAIATTGRPTNIRAIYGGTETQDPIEWGVGAPDMAPLGEGSAYEITVADLPGGRLTALQSIVINAGSGDLTFATGVANMITLTAPQITITADEIVLGGRTLILNSEGGTLMLNVARFSGSPGAALTLMMADMIVGSVPIVVAVPTVRIMQNGAFSATAPFMFGTEVTSLTLETMAAQNYYSWMRGTAPNVNLTLSTSDVLTIGSDSDINTGTGDLTLGGATIVLGGTDIDPPGNDDRMFVTRRLEGGSVTFNGEIADGTTCDGCTLTLRVSSRAGDITFNENIDFGENVFILRAMGGNIRSDGTATNMPPTIMVRNLVMRQDGAFGQYLFHEDSVVSNAVRLRINTATAQIIHPWLADLGANVLALIGSDDTTLTSITTMGNISNSSRRVTLVARTITLGGQISSGSVMLGADMIAGSAVNIFATNTITIVEANVITAANITDPITGNVGVPTLASSITSITLDQGGAFGASAPFTFGAEVISLTLETMAAQNYYSWMRGTAANVGLSLTSGGALTINGAVINLGTGNLALTGATIVLGGDVELTANNINLTGNISGENADGADRALTITATTKLTLDGNIQTGTNNLTLGLGSAAADFTGARQLGGGVITITGTMGIVGTGDLTITALGNLNVNTGINIGANALTLEAGATEGNGAGQIGTILFDDSAIILQAMFFLLIQDGDDAVFPAIRPVVFQNPDGGGIATTGRPPEIRVIYGGTEMQNPIQWGVDAPPNATLGARSAYQITVADLPGGRLIASESIVINAGSGALTFAEEVPSEVMFAAPTITITAGSFDLGARTLIINSAGGTLTLNVARFGGSQALVLMADTIAGSVPIVAVPTVNIMQNGAFSATAPFTFGTEVTSLTLETMAAQNYYSWMRGDAGNANFDLSLTSGGALTINEAEINLGDGDLTLSGSSIAATNAGGLMITAGAVGLTGVLNTSTVAVGGTPVTIDASGMLTINNNIVTDLAPLTLDGSSIVLTGTVRLVGGSVTLNGPIDGTCDGCGLRVVSRAGNITLNGDVNLGGGDLTLLSGSSIAATNADGLTIMAGAVGLTGVLNTSTVAGRGTPVTITASGVLTINNNIVTDLVPLTLGGSSIVLTGTGTVRLVGGSVTLNGPIDGTSCVSCTLRVVSRAGDITLNGDIDLGTGDLTLDSMGGITLGGTGTRRITGGVITSTGAITASNTNINFQVMASGVLTVNDNIDVGTGDLTLSSTNSDPLAAFAFGTGVGLTASSFTFTPDFTCDGTTMMPTCTDTTP